MKVVHLPPVVVRAEEPPSSPCPRCGNARVLIGHPAVWSCPVHATA